MLWRAVRSDFSKIMKQKGMYKVVTLERLIEAYEACIKRKRGKLSAMEFSDDNLLPNLLSIVDDINTRTYKTSPSTCFVVQDPTTREIFAADFRDRIVQHFYIQEISNILDNTLIDATTSCRLGKGTSYALELLKTYLTTVSETGKKDCFYLKIDLSGYFMSLNRDYLNSLFLNLIKTSYTGEYKDELIYLTPIIYKDDPTFNCIIKASQELFDSVPERKSIFKAHGKGLAIGNLTAQAGSNLNLNAFDHYCIETLRFNEYVRYVDDIIIISNSRNKLVKALPLITKKLAESGQVLNQKKTHIDTAYHGVPFLGKMSYPYGTQTLTKITRNRLFDNARNMPLDDSTLPRLNSQIGLLRHYAVYKDIIRYYNLLPKKVRNSYALVKTKISTNPFENEYKFILINTQYNE